MGTGSSFENELLQSLLALSQPATDARIEAQVRDLLRGRFRRYLEPRLPGRLDAALVVELALDDVVRGAGRCDAVQDPQHPSSALAATAWVFRVASHRASHARRDWFRNAGEVDTPQRRQEPSLEPGAEEAAVDQEERQRKTMLVSQLEGRIWQVIRTGHPPDLRKLATLNGVGSNWDTLRRQLYAFEKLRGEGQSALDVGVRMGLTGGEKRVRAHVAQLALRGSAALHIAARAALLNAPNDERRALLEGALAALPLRKAEVPP